MSKLTFNLYSTNCCVLMEQEKLHYINLMVDKCDHYDIETNQKLFTCKFNERVCFFTHLIYTSLQQDHPLGAFHSHSHSLRDSRFCISFSANIFLRYLPLVLIYLFYAESQFHHHWSLLKMEIQYQTAQLLKKVVYIQFIRVDLFSFDDSSTPGLYFIIDSSLFGSKFELQMITVCFIIIYRKFAVNPFSIIPCFRTIIQQNDRGFFILGNLLNWHAAPFFCIVHRQ